MTKYKLKEMVFDNESINIPFSSSCYFIDEIEAELIKQEKEG